MSVNGDGYYIQPPQVDFNWLSEGWSQFRQRPSAWIGAILLYGIIYILLEALMIVPTGLLAYYQGLFHSMNNPSRFQTMTPAPPNMTVAIYGISFLVGVVDTVLMGGLFRMAYRQIQGQEINAADLFSVGDCFSQLILLGVIKSVITLIGGYSCGIPGLIFYGLAMFAPLIIVSQGASATAAISESYRLLKGSWLMAILFVIVAALLYSVSFLACFLGEFVTLPMIFLAVAYGYTRFSGPQYAQFPGYGAPQPGTWPPPPGQNPQPYDPLQSPYGQPPQGYGQPQQPQGYGQPQPGPSFGQPPQQGGQWLGGDPPASGDSDEPPRQ